MGIERLAASAATVAALVASDASCHVFTKLSDCASDTDCPLGDRCNPSESFCEPDHGPILVGATLGLTGSLGSFGADLKTGLDFAESYVNGAGGVAGRTLHFEVVDDEGDEALAEKNAQDFVAARAAAVIGPLRSAQALRTAAATYGAHVLDLTPFAGASALATAQPATDRYFFQTITSIRRGSAAAIALYATTQATVCSKLALMHIDDLTGNDYADQVTDLLTKNGGCVGPRIKFPNDLKSDYRAEVGALVASRATCAMLVALPNVGAAIVREFQAETKGDPSWARFRFIGTTSLHTDDFLKESLVDPGDPSKGSEAEGFVGADIDVAPETPEYAKFRVAYNDFMHRAPDTPPPNLVANAFDAAMLVALAIERAAGVSSRERLRDALVDVANAAPGDVTVGPTDLADALRALRRGASIDYKGASGEIEFDAFGVVSEPTLIWSVQGGAFAIAQRYSEEATRNIVDAEPRVGACP
jgi:branched-chain amino acid transport system substrate-binding protein